jgi:hypothetical protein
MINLIAGVFFLTNNQVVNAEINNTHYLQQKIENSSITCGNSIKGGWQVTALGGKAAANSPPVLTSATWIYNVNLTGNQAKFIQSSTWFPKP